VRRVDYDLGQGKAKGNGNGNRITDGRAIDYAYDGLKKKSFKHMVLERLDAIEPKLRDSPVFKQPGMSDAHIDKALGQFRWYVRENVSNEDRKGDASHLQHKLFDALKDRGSIGLDSELQYALYNHFLGKNFSPADIENQRALADLRYPTEWFPVPRTMHRTIHAHIGPTNSGKTYHALKRLEQAKAGLYAGPLRLLAHEVYSRLNANGKLCALVTGEEQRLPEGWQEADSKIVAATVEMTSLNSEYDVAVIDEIQMLSSLERGFAWTQALLGLRSKEIHVCGELRALPVIRELAAAAGDKLVVHEYDRLTRLKMDESSLNGSFARLRKGDCIVTFSVVNIHALRTEVEKKTGKKVAVVYGSLPPETRAQQARLFNDPNNDYDYLIASDAVGMGLNL
jgi:ATP-dependent RNA helicase SUPV3L1/SUV3